MRKCEQIQDQAEKEERDRTIIAHLPLVKAIAVRVHRMLPVHVELEDLIQAGIMGLIDALDKFDSGRQVTFRAYAKHRIRGAILDSLRHFDWLSRDMRRMQKEVEATQLRLACKLHRTATDSEMTEAMGIDIARYRRIIAEVGLVAGPLSTRRSADQDNRLDVHLAAAPETQPDAVYATTALHRALVAALKTLPIRFQTVIRLYYLNGRSMSEIGDALGVTKNRVSQIHKLALAMLASALDAAGFRAATLFDCKPVTSRIPRPGEALRRGQHPADANAGAPDTAPRQRHSSRRKLAQSCQWLPIPAAVGRSA
jgi:RNA polymerase sigma factor for flagellar operon FliA